MWTCYRYLFYALSMSACFVLIFYSYRVDFGHPKGRVQELHIVQELPIARDTITALDNRTLIISVYYEPRLEQTVRVIAILHESVKELYCIFHCSINQVVFIKTRADFHSDTFDFPYETADLLCTEPSGCDYTYMSFSSIISSNTSQYLRFEVRNRPPQPISSNFTVCISTLYGKYNNVLQMVQHFEMYKILGASKVTIYKTSVSPDVEKVLRHYTDEGFLDVVPWPIDRHLKTSFAWKYTPGLNAEISYFGQIAILNDCLYRNMYKSKFVLLNDIDEIILPIIDPDWSSLMERLQKQFPNTSVFSFVTHVFSPPLDKSSKFDLWSHVPGINIFHHNFRQPINPKMGNPRKMIVNPKKVVRTSIHFAVEKFGQSTVVPNNLAINFHCKKRKRIDENRTDYIQDEILWKYNMSLVPNVDKVIQKLFPLPTAPSLHPQ